MRILLYTLLLLVALPCTAQTLRIGHDLDSICMHTDRQAYQGRFQTRVFLYERHKDYDAIMLHLKLEEAEAKAQGRSRDYDMAHRNMAGMMLINGMDSILLAEVPKYLEECDRLESNDIYYHIMGILVNHYLQSGNMHTAYLLIKQCQKEMDDNDLIGEAFCSHFIGDFFMHESDYSASVEYFKLAISQLSELEGDEVEIYRLASLGDLAYCYIRSNQMDLAWDMCERWDNALDACHSIAPDDVKSERIRINYMRSVVAYERGDVESVHAVCRLMDSLFDDGDDVEYNDLKRSIELFDQIVSGNYDDAIVTVNELISLYDSQKSRTLLMAMFRLKIVVLHKMNNENAAYETFSEYYLHDMELHQEMSNRSHSEFAAIYELEKSKTAERRTQMKLVVAFAFLILVVAFSVVIFVYYRRLKAKVAILCQNLDEMAKLKESKSEDEPKVSISSVLDQQVDGIIVDKSDGQALFSQIEALFKDPEIFASELDRDNIARMVCSNRTYVANSIKEATGKSVSEYVNGKRLDAAVVLIKGKADMSMAEIAQAVGFQSYTTFYRLFSKAYGVTPVDYRGYVANR